MTLSDIKNNPWALARPLLNRGWLDWLSDEACLKLRYRAFMGKKLDLAAPVTFNEKLQWLKLYDRKPEYTTMVDKYAVREYIAAAIGEEYLIPLLGGPWDSFDEIDFDALPEQFVLKCTHDSGGLVFCRDKATLDKEKARAKIEQCLKKNFYLRNREWPYKDVKPRIIAEALMTDEAQPNGLVDYKFYCFGGEAKALYVSEGLEDHSTASISFLTMDWQFAPFQRGDFKNFDALPTKPTRFAEMTKLAQRLAGEQPFLRVDMYEIRGRIYFSELTFYPCSGMMPFQPESWDETVGSWLTLPQKQA